MIEPCHGFCNTCIPRSRLQIHFRPHFFAGFDFTTPWVVRINCDRSVISSWSHDIGQRIPCFDRCQLTICITWMSNIMKGYWMVFASICEHTSSAFIFASTSGDQICLASNEHFVYFPVGGKRKGFGPSNPARWHRSTNPSSFIWQPIMLNFVWCQITLVSFTWASVRNTRQTLKGLSIRRCEQITRRS